MREDSTTEFRDQLKTSWLFKGVPQYHHLVDNDLFLKYAGLPLLLAGNAPTSESDPQLLKAHIASILTESDFGLNMKALDAFERGQFLSHVSDLDKLDKSYEARIFILAGLLTQILLLRPYGYTLEKLAEHYIRPSSWGLAKNIPEGVSLHLHVSSPFGKTFEPENQKEVRKWQKEDWVKYLKVKGVTKFEIEKIAGDIDEQKQPYVSLDMGFRPDAPQDFQPRWGVSLESLSPLAIWRLGKESSYCAPDCYCYHRDVEDYKKSGELIAPVDAKVFAKELIESYRQWKSRLTKDPKDKKDRFHVLIPAQADETTIVGILNLVEKELGREVILEDFTFVLSDLCPTPLLRSYSHLKEMDLLKVANVVVNDVFSWGLEQGTYDFVAADHLVDLFKPDLQRRLIFALVNSLSVGGKLVLTVRCGTKRTLTQAEALAEAYQKVDSQIEEQITILEGEGEIEQKRKAVRSIYSLLVYRYLRSIYPFEDKSSLEAILGEIKAELLAKMKIGIEVRIDDIPDKENDVTIVIRKTSGNPMFLPDIMIQLNRSKV